MATYHNPYGKTSRDYQSTFSTDAVPVEYQGFLLYHRIKSSTMAGNVWDAVIHNTCVAQMCTQRALMKWISESRWEPGNIYSNTVLLRVQVEHEREVYWPWEKWKEWFLADIEQLAEKAGVRFHCELGTDLCFFGGSRHHEISGSSAAD